MTNLINELIRQEFPPPTTRTLNLNNQNQIRQTKSKSVFLEQSACIKKVLFYNNLKSFDISV